jgi:hypothetical protein
VFGHELFDPVVHLASVYFQFILQGLASYWRPEKRSAILPTDPSRSAAMRAFLRRNFRAAKAALHVDFMN